jgi:hypothetical protein
MKSRRNENVRDPTLNAVEFGGAELSVECWALSVERLRSPDAETPRRRHTDTR